MDDKKLQPESHEILFEPRTIDLAWAVDWLVKTDPRVVKHLFLTIWDKPGKALRKLSDNQLNAVKPMASVGFREAAKEHQKRYKEILIKQKRQDLRDNP